MGRESMLGSCRGTVDPGPREAGRPANCPNTSAHSRAQPLGRQLSCTHRCVWHLRAQFSTLAADRPQGRLRKE